MGVLDGIPSSTREQIVKLCGEGRCNLLLGAGASADSLDAHGRPLPLGRELARELCDYMDLEVIDDLRQVATRVKRRGREGELADYLRVRFTGCQPASWWHQVVALPWNRIWTLNIDDACENAWASTFRNKALQQMSPLSWTDSFRDDTNLQLVYLHGRARDHRPNFVFGISDYVDKVTSDFVWHRAFGDLWVTGAFITVGARLSDEIDLERFILQREREKDVPILYVARSIDSEVRKDLLSLDITPVEASAAEFFAELAPLVKKRLQVSASRRTDRAHVHFSQQFRELDLEDRAPERQLSRFYGGQHPQWQQIAAGFEVDFEWIDQLVARARHSLDEAPSLLLLLGGRFSGRTTGLFRAAKLLLESGENVFLYRGEGGLQADSVLRACDDLGRVVLLVDGVAPFAQRFVELVEGAQQRGQKVVVLAADGARRLPLLLSLMPRHVMSVDSITSSELSIEDTRRIDSRLDSAGLLNYLQRESRPTRLRIFQQSGLYGGLYRASLGPHFRTRMRAIIDDVNSPGDRRLALFAAICEEAGVDLRVDIARLVLPVPIDRLLSLGQGEDAIGDLVRIDHGRVLALYRYLALDSLKETEGAEVLKSVCLQSLIALSPLVNRHTIRSGSPQADMFKGLCRARFLAKILGIEGAVDVLRLVEQHFGWDGGYWEQRAIAERKRRNWSESESFAVKAVDLLGDDHRLTTLASILFERARLDRSLDAGSAYDMSVRALAVLEEAIVRRGSNPVPVLVALRGLRCFAQCWTGQLADPESTEILLAWNKWLSRGRHSERNAAGEFGSELAAEEERWVPVATSLANGQDGSQDEDRETDEWIDEAYT